MKEIKFRAVIDGKLELVRSVADGMSKGTWLVCVGDLSKWSDWEPAEIVSQYTGLKDKNGQEIYEGDILKLQDRLVQVVWLKCGATFDTKFIKYTKDIEHRMGFCEVDNYSWHRYEVVGNIYENPELVR